MAKALKPGQAFADLISVGDDEGGFFLATAYMPAGGEAASMPLTVRGDGVYLGDSPTQAISSRTWGDAVHGAVTLYLGRYEAARRFEGLPAAPRSRAAAKPQGADKAILGAIRPLWAGEQMDAISENLLPEDRDGAVRLHELGKEHGVMTPFSALLVLEPGVQ
jgi:hypothetical protein